jgi:hypothetical protein
MFLGGVDFNTGGSDLAGVEGADGGSWVGGQGFMALVGTPSATPAVSAIAPAGGKLACGGTGRSAERAEAGESSRGAGVVGESGVLAPDAALPLLDELAKSCALVDAMSSMGGCSGAGSMP